MNIHDTILSMATKARAASAGLAKKTTDEKNAALLAIADSLEKNRASIVAANGIDLAHAKEAGISPAMIDRLTLTPARFDAMVAGVRHVATLPDPVGETIWTRERPSGINIRKVRVPLGVIGVIYESRPNVTADTAALCLKSGNAVILRGGSEAVNSNRIIAKVLTEAALSVGLPDGCIQLLDLNGREFTTALMELEELDVIIPRGGLGLKAAVREHCKVPYIMTGDGVCHIYFAPSADPEMCVPIAVNAKCQKPSACNAVETLLFHEKCAPKLIPAVCTALEAHGVELRGDKKACELFDMTPATEEDWGTEYLDLVVSIKVVSSLNEALAHIAKYGTHHSESIITRDYAEAERFLDSVDAAAVYVNASTRFTDGGVFGLGAEVGISTQKLHARGPMGIEQLTSTKFRVRGSGQVRR